MAVWYAWYMGVMWVGNGWYTRVMYITHGGVVWVVCG